MIKDLQEASNLKPIETKELYEEIKEFCHYQVVIVTWEFYEYPCLSRHALSWLFGLGTCLKGRDSNFFDCYMWMKNFFCKLFHIWMSFPLKPALYQKAFLALLCKTLILLKLWIFFLSNLRDFLLSCRRIKGNILFCSAGKRKFSPFFLFASKSDLLKIWCSVVCCIFQKEKFPESALFFLLQLSKHLKCLWFPSRHISFSTAGRSISWILTIFIIYWGAEHRRGGCVVHSRQFRSGHCVKTARKEKIFLS